MTGLWLGFIRCIVGAWVLGGLWRCGRVYGGVVAGRLVQKDGRFPVFVDGGLHVWGWWMLGLEKEAWILWFRALWPSRPCFLFRRPRATPDLPFFFLCVACSALGPPLLLLVMMNQARPGTGATG
jgi:hypothetical protein